ncbi:MFS transporter [Dactylosporangium aurantiacum]|uniref:MFS transporter n=1 Tax=Dactylosporangium aurantiacum TaxID=35754 RepID=A0A9Q9IGN5_9ACTN|nr:MFS transporter [Dactylosporangium aurantiacum]MDG6104721.1 MFS transporter [Dactylosporangium aurantiacum]UWZ55712.1 MFS transporter [Dactylosporangium aurantiacum]
MQRRNALTAGMVTLVTFVAFEAVAVTAAMPTVAQALDGVALYGFAFGGPFATGIVATVAAGTWCDRRGPARPTLTGVVLFSLGLLVAGLAQDIWTLIAGRLVQGFGGGLITVALYVVVGRAYPAAEHPKVFSALSAAWVLPAVVGPAVAGLIVEHLGWRWVFLLIAAATLPVAAVIHPHVRRIAGGAGTAAGTRVPWAVGVAGGVLLLHWGGQRHGLDALLLVAGGLLVVAACGPRLLPAGTFTGRRGLPSVILVRGFAGAAFMQADVFIPLLLTRERGLTPSLAGLTLTAGALLWSAGSWIQARQGQRFTPAVRLRAGLTGIALGVLSAVAMVAPAVPVAAVVAGWCVAGFGMGLASPTVSALVLQLSPPDEQGVNSSALSVADSLLTTVVLAVGGSVFAALVTAGPAAYLAAFLIALLPAVAGALLAGRVTVRTPAAPAAVASPRAAVPG